MQTPVVTVGRLTIERMDPHGSLGAVGVGEGEGDAEVAAGALCPNAAALVESVPAITAIMIRACNIASIIDGHRRRVNGQKDDPLGIPLDHPNGRGATRVFALFCGYAPRDWGRRARDRLLRPARPLRAGLREGLVMQFDDVLGLILTVAGLAYLVFAMLRPEKF